MLTENLTRKIMHEDTCILRAPAVFPDATHIYVSLRRIIRVSRVNKPPDDLV